MENQYIQKENEIKNIFSLINEASSFEESNKLFSLLESIQLDLARQLFKEHAEMSEKLEEFVRKFDRIDDIDLRKNVFFEIKNNTYKF